MKVKDVTLRALLRFFRVVDRFDLSSVAHQAQSSVVCLFVCFDPGRESPAQHAPDRLRGVPP